MLVLGEHELGRFAPLGRVFPAVLDQAARVAVDLHRKSKIDKHLDFIMKKMHGMDKP